MSEYFSFAVDIPIEQSTERIIFVFMGISDLNELSLGAELQKQMESEEYPDHIAILIPEFLFEEFIKYSKEVRSPVYTSLNRGGRRISSIMAAGYDASGQIKSFRKMKGAKGLSKSELNESLTLAKTAGIGKIALDTEACSRSPHGFIFSKPSSRKSNYFIRAENLLYETGMVFFVGFCLLDKIYAWQKDSGKRLEVIYIDSMGISALAFAISTMIKALNTNANYPQIQSFHSYEGIEENIPFHQQSFCIISASSSNGLAKKWNEYTGCHQLGVITLLSFHDAKKDFPVLHFIKKPEDYESFEESDNNHGRSEVRIVGERFSFRPSKPRSIELTISHAPEKLESVLSQVVGKNIIKCRFSDKHKIRELYFDTALLLVEKDFKDWLSRCLDEIAPLSTRTLIYQDDNSSALIKDLAIEFFREQGISNLDVLSSEELFSHTNPISGSVLIVAGTVGAGTVLLNISRKLRKLHTKGTRVYVCGALIGKEESNNESLKKNLSQPAKGNRKHRFEPFIEAAIGEDRDSWKKEIQLLNKILEANESEILSNRRDALNRVGEGLIDNAFYPNCFTTSPLTLSNGFAFCGENFRCEEASNADMFFAMSWILQHSREPKHPLTAPSALSSSDLQQAVIAPKNFSRFDDGIIQAAILRSALSSELDFRDSRELSESMAKIMERIFTQHDRDRGEAAMDFAVALAVGKLRLTNQVQTDLIELIKSNQQLPEHLRLIINHC